MKNILKRGLSIMCIISMMPSTAFAQTNEQSENMSEDTAVIEKIDDSGLTDEEFAELESKIDEYIAESKKNKEEGYIKPKLSIPRSVLKDDENEISTLATGDYNEYEPNDTMKNADRLYLDEYVYGTIEDRDDIDYFRIKFSEIGQGYFRLVVPDTEDYELYLISSNGTVIDDSTSGTDGESERIYAFVSPDEYYYVRVEGAGSSDYDDTEEYKIRVKFYDDVDEYAFLVGANFKKYDPGIGDKYPNSNEIDTTDTIDELVTTLGKTDYYRTVDIYEPTFEELDDVNSDDTDRLGSSVVVLDGHGEPTHIKFYHNISADEPVVCGVSTNIRDGVHALDIDPVVGSPYADFEYTRLRDKELENRLMVFAACNTADEPDDSSKKNLPEYATDRGAECAIGWVEKVDEGALNGWTRRFFDRLVEGYTVYESALYADERYKGDEVTSWEIYGNEDCIIWPDNGTPISRSVAMPMNIDESSGNDKDYMGIEISKNDISGIDEYISSNYEVDLDDYEMTIKERENNVIQIFYNRHINGFDTNSGFYAIAKDGKIIYFNEVVNDANDYEELINTEVSVSDEDIEKAKDEAKNRISNMYEINSQEVSKEIVDGRYSLVVDTEYTIDAGTDDQVYGCDEYVYVL